MGKLATPALIAALLACLGLGGALWWKSGELVDLRQDKIDLTHELAVKETAIAQAKEARAVADARAARHAAEVVELDAVREWINRSGNDAPMPDLLRLTLDRLYGPAN